MKKIPFTREEKELKDKQEAFALSEAKGQGKLPGTEPCASCVVFVDESTPMAKEDYDKIRGLVGSANVEVHVIGSIQTLDMNGGGDWLLSSPELASAQKELEGVEINGPEYMDALGRMADQMKRERKGWNEPTKVVESNG